MGACPERILSVGAGQGPQAKGLNAQYCKITRRFRNLTWGNMQVQQVNLNAFRALIGQKVGAIQALGTRDGFCLTVGSATLITDAGTVRTFKNLTTLARFAKGENVSALTLDLSHMPKPKKRTAKVSAKAPKKQAARKAAAAA
jgi:hypothetical protein